MSAIPLDDAFERVASDGRAARKLPPLALVYLLAVAAVAVGVSLPLLAELKPTSGYWVTFVILGASVALAQLFVVRTPRKQVVPHDRRLPDPGRAPAAAGARRADRGRPARPGLAAQSHAPGTSSRSTSSTTRWRRSVRGRARTSFSARTR